MAHCKEYNRLLDLFRAMCIVSFTNNCITTQFVRFVSDDKIKQLFQDTEQCEDNFNEEDRNNIPLYETSPFYKDCYKIFEALKKKYAPEESGCMEMFLQKYMAYAPMWTSACHEPKSETIQTKYIPFFRFNTNHIEKYWGEIKEKLRAQVLEYGKTPIPASRFMRFKKIQVCIY